MVKILKTIHTPTYVILIRGVFLLFFSYSPYLLETHQITYPVIMAAFALFSLGTIDIFEFITLELAEISLKRSIYRNRRTLVKHLIVALLGGVLLEGVLQWLAKAWVYPFWNTLFYSLIFVVGFSFYFLVIMESYLAFKVIFDKLLKGKKFITKPSNLDRILLKAFLILGIPSLILGLYLLISNYNSIGYIFSINKKVPLDIMKVSIGTFFTLLGVFSIIEYLLHRNRRVTFLQTITHGYFSPLLAVITASFILLALMETQNAITLLWEYDNVPLDHIKVFSIPILGVVAWPLHYIPLIDLYALIFGDDEIHLLNGDKME